MSETNSVSLFKWRLLFLLLIFVVLALPSFLLIKSEFVSFNEFDVIDVVVLAALLKCVYNDYEYVRIDVQVCVFVWWFMNLNKNAGKSKIENKIKNKEKLNNNNNMEKI